MSTVEPCSCTCACCSLPWRVRRFQVECLRTAGVIKELTRCFGGRFSTKDTRPGEDAWVDVIQLVDGHWTPSGDGLVVSDVAGQLHLYGLGSNEFMAYSRYDQFLSSDYRPIRITDDGRVLDEEYETEAHIRTDRCISCPHIPFHMETHCHPGSPGLKEAYSIQAESARATLLLLYSCFPTLMGCSSSHSTIDEGRILALSCTCTLLKPWSLRRALHRFP